jgi:tetratricopeptide (TPR) repeat protein
MDASRELNWLIAQLREHLTFRRIESGMAALESCRPLILALDPSQKNAGSFLGLLAQWVDAGFAGPQLVRKLLDRFPHECRATLPLIDYLHLRMAEGMVAMAEEEFDLAMRHFQLVQSLETEIGDAEMLAICNFWMGRCLRREGRYDDALAYTVKGKNLALETGHEQMAAAMQVLESWLAFQKGKLKEAAAILRRAESALGGTDDFVSLGNIYSAYGRIARRQGRYDEALGHFERSIAAYKRWDPHHLHLARSFVNIAFVKRLIALQVQRAMDEEAARRRAQMSPERGAPPRAEREKIERLRGEARAELAEALEIYAKHGNHRGIGSVHINSAFLHLDAGDLDAATADAAEAFRHGDEKHDNILLARARTIQCMIENARLEEQVGEDLDRHARMAETFAREAVEYAGQTQNRRLLARALVWQGLTYASEHLQDQATARRCAERAAGLLHSDAQEYRWEEFDLLRSKVVQAGRVHPVLQEWSEGLVGEKTFQEITEEFAGVIIPKVWEREGRKISRVAARLSISPKKVRRILSAAGLLGERSKGAGEDA